MALTKDKLFILLQAQLGRDRQESRQIVERLLKIMNYTLSQREDLLISGFGKFSVRQKRARQGGTQKVSLVQCAIMPSTRRDNFPG
jgi:integration host factor subunit alpha